MCVHVLAAVIATVLQLVQVVAFLLVGGNGLSHGLDEGHVQVGHDEGWFVVGGGHNVSPRCHNGGMPPCRVGRVFGRIVFVVVIGTSRRGGQDKALIVHRTSPLQQFPMSRAGR